MKLTADHLAQVLLEQNRPYSWSGPIVRTPYNWNSARTLIVDGPLNLDRLAERLNQFLLISSEESPK